MSEEEFLFEAPQELLELYLKYGNGREEYRNDVSHIPLAIMIPLVDITPPDTLVIETHMFNFVIEVMRRKPIYCVSADIFVKDYAERDIDKAFLEFQPAAEYYLERIKMLRTTAKWYGGTTGLHVDGENFHKQAITE